MPTTRTPARKKPPARRKPSVRARPRSRARASRQPLWRLGVPPLEQHHIDLIGLAVVCAGVFLAFPLYLGWDGGRAGAAMLRGCRWLGGDVAYAAPIGLVAAGAVTVMRPALPALRPFRSGALCLIAASTLAFATGTFGLGPGPAPQQWTSMYFERRGGIIGDGLHYATTSLVGSPGTHLVAVFLFLAGVILLTGASLAGVLKATGNGVADTTRALRRGSEELAALARAVPRSSTVDGFGSELSPHATLDPFVPEPVGEEPIVTRSRQVVVEEPPSGGYDLADDELEGEEEPAAAALAEATDGPPEEGRISAPHALGGEVEWNLPEPRAVLRISSEEAQRPDTRGQELTITRLVEALSHFGIQAQVIGAVAGPHITRYELRLAPGVKMSKVAQLKDDLAYALAATDIRILAPIPGKTAVGVEVPNAKRKVVQLGDIFQPRPPDWSPLTVWLGKDVGGNAIASDLAKMPHVLVAGTTGAGKSACVNAMLSSILLQARPDEVRLVLVDPKQVELNHYEHVPHLLTPVITSPRKAANALQNLVREMEWRYGIMAMARTRSLPELNRHRLANDDEPLPYILCVIDELADLMMVAPADVEDSIIRLAQKARAVGIHLVLATQSPRVDVITGMIKANVPSRIAFAVSSQTDSRVILDQNGAESLLGQGDLLFSPVGSSKLQRIQGAYIDEAPDREADRASGRGRASPSCARSCSRRSSRPQTPAAARATTSSTPMRIALLGDAIALVVEMGTASTSMLQRRLRLGYTRAGRLIDMLERRGVISGYEGSKPRTVLITEGDLPRVAVESLP